MGALKCNTGALKCNIGALECNIGAPECNTGAPKCITGFLLVTRILNIYTSIQTTINPFFLNLNFYIIA